ncbi:MAG: cell division protein ZapA [Anaerovoracaceae bacterium]
MDNNKVNVKIYGQEYVIAGEKTREQIVRIAAYVDSQVHEVAKAVGSCPVSSLAVLSAVNIAEEHFESLEKIEELKRLNTQLEKDAQHYVQLWDEAKQTFIQYKEETQSVMQQKENMVKLMNEKDREIEELKKSAKYVEAEIKKSSQGAVEKIEEKCKELENSFFDLQMENLQLKKELESQRRKMD